MVSIPGASVMHPEIDKSSRAWLREKVHLPCTNASLFERKNCILFKPSTYLTFSVHVDGQKEHHDFSVCREGGYDLAIDGFGKR